MRNSKVVKLKKMFIEKFKESYQMEGVTFDYTFNNVFKFNPSFELYMYSDFIHVVNPVMLLHTDYVFGQYYNCILEKRRIIKYSSKERYEELLQGNYTQVIDAFEKDCERVTEYINQSRSNRDEKEVLQKNPEIAIRKFSVDDKESCISNYRKNYIGKARIFDADGTDLMDMGYRFYKWDMYKMEFSYFEEDKFNGTDKDADGYDFLRHVEIHKDWKMFVGDVEIKV